LCVNKWQDDKTVNFWTYRPPPFYDYVDRVVLPFACRQLHHETSLLPYQLATFDFGEAHVHHGNTISENRVMKAFLKARTKAQLEALGQMRVRVDWYQAFGFDSRMMTGDGAFWAAMLNCQKTVP